MSGSTEHARRAPAGLPCGFAWHWRPAQRRPAERVEYLPRERLASGESAESVGRGLGRSALAVEGKARAAGKKARREELEDSAGPSQQLGPADSDSESCEVID